MRVGSSFALSLFGASAWAFPQLQGRASATCNADNCLRAAKASSAKPGAASAASDCSSFMRKTVTPCPATSFTTTTVTVTNAPSYTTLVNTLDQTVVNTVQQTITSVVATIEDTVTFIQPTEVDVINIIVTAVTVTYNPYKRDAEMAPLPPNPTVPVELRARSATAAGTCAASTSAPTGVPAYASACSGAVRYSSACSCAGVTGATTTLSQATVISTATTTSTVTPIVPVTQTAINTVPVTVVQTVTVPTTFETTDATLIIQPLYKFVIADEPRASQFLNAQDPSTSGLGYAFISYTSDCTSAKTWNTHADGNNFKSKVVFSWVTHNNQLYYMLETNDLAVSTYQLDNLKCAVLNGGNSYPGAIGKLACTMDQGTPNYLVPCAGTGSNLLQSPNMAAAGNGCYALNVNVVPGC